MNKYIIIFRLYDPDPTSKYGLLDGCPKLNRAEKYQKLIEYLNEIGEYQEDATTSTIYVNANTEVDVLINSIQEACKLFGEDIIRILYFLDTNFVKDITLLERKHRINDIKDWLSNS